MITGQALIDAAQLIPVLDGEGPFTVYAPTHAAFGALPPELVAFLQANPLADLVSVLTYHVTRGQGRELDPRRVLAALEEDGLPVPEEQFDTLVVAV